MEQIQRKLGAEAVIYSQKKTENGIEVIAGLPNPAISTNKAQTSKTSVEDSLLEKIKTYDNPEIMAELQAIEKYNLLMKKLRKLNFPYEFSDDFAKTYSSSCTKETILNNEMIIKILLSKIHVEETELIHLRKICALVGPTGIGKSTTVAKLARRFASKFGTHKLGIISTDFQRIITKNQFYYFGKLLNIQIEYARDDKELKEAIRFLDDKRLILIDTAGVNQNDNQKIAELCERLSEEIPSLTSYLVLPCNLQHDILDDVVTRFKMKHIAGCILTKTDECKSLAPCLSVVMKHKLDIAYCCNGQNIVKDMYVPTRVQLINDVFQGEKSDQHPVLSI